MDIVRQLQEGVGYFSAQESRVATFILENLSFTADASIEALAEKSGVSPATITRFARSMGCDGIRHFRKQLAQASGRYTAQGRNEGDKLACFREEKLAQIYEHLEWQLRTTREQAVSQLTAAVQNCREIHCFALGDENIELAMLLEQQLSSASISINVCCESAKMQMRASQLSDRDLLFVLCVGKADIILHCAILLARVQEVAIFTLTPEDHPLNSLSSTILPLPADHKMARYALLMLTDLLQESLRN